MPSRLTPTIDQAAVNVIRGMALDAPLRAKSGHQGTALALAPLAHVLYSRVLKHDPADPHWADRDRFILSAGHASILQYALLYLQGYGLEIEDLRNFRQWQSATPGHPENCHTAGVEVTTGPLGQGLANAVGMALAERHLRARFGSEVCNHHVYSIVGDGCLMEGISHEAASLAGHQKLDHLIVIFDDNKITIDGSTDLTCSDDVAQRFTSYGWEVTQLGGISEDLDALERALLTARQTTSGRPQLLILPTRVAFPSPDWTDRHEAHGNPFTEADIIRTKDVMGIPHDSFWSPEEIVTACRSAARAQGAVLRQSWSERIARHPQRDEWDALWQDPSPGWDGNLPVFALGENIATRVAIQKAFDAALPNLPGLVAGSADLTGNTGTKLTGQEPMNAVTPEGRQIYFGIREHAMGAAMVGMALHGGIYPVGGTFFVFFDYMKPAVRLAALSGSKCLFVFTHDSVGVGEDGPTHQPIEQLAALRSIPNLQVIRPADANETSAALRAALEFDGPTALVLSRQNIPVVTDGAAVGPGAAIVRSADDPDLVLVATGSEVHLALRAAEVLESDHARKCQVVSMPSWDRFEAYRTLQAEGAAKILPSNTPTLSVEAGSTFGWERYADRCIGIDRFGASAPGAMVLDRLGINDAHIVKIALEMLS